MEVTVLKEDLSGTDSGGGYRRVYAEVTVDKSLQPRPQRQAVLYETLALMLDSIVSHERLTEMTNILGEALDQLEGG